jgi:RNA polymerase sigma factor (sigma-70 family)
MSETELLNAFRKEQSEEAFAELVRRYAGLVYSVAKRRLANAALAEDITQIVFIRFAKTPPRVRSHGELVAWLHRTTLNVAIDAWRSETRRRSREQQVAVMEPGTNTAWEDISPKLDEALNQLNDEDRQALLLRFFGRKAMRDVGVALGVSEDAAKMRVSRAVGRLRTQLGVGGAACSVAVLGTMLTEHSVEAAPGQLISRLAAMRMPAAVGVVGMGGLAGGLQGIFRLKLAAGAVVLGLIGVSVVYLLRSSDTPASELVSSPPTQAIGEPAEKASRERFDTTDFNASVAPPTRAVKILFHVLDAETGGGLADAQIHFVFFGPGGEGEGHDMLTDKNGDASIPEPEDPTRNSGPNVFVTAEGHVPKVVGFSQGAVPSDYTMRLDPAMTAGGVVVDEEGSPVGGVKILVEGPGNKLDQMENVDFQTCPVTNREDGTWSCSYIPKDYTNEIHFILKKPGYAATFPVVPVVRVDLTNLVLVINRGFTIRGHVTGTHQPVADAKIRILTEIPNKRQSAKTDEHGDFTIAGVPSDAVPVFLHDQPPLETNNAGGVVIRASDTMIPAGKPTPLTGEDLRRLERLRSEVQADLARQKALLERLKKLTGEELVQTISTTGMHDPTLSSLVEQLASREQELASLNNGLGPQDSEAQETDAIAAELKEKIDTRVRGVLLGLDQKVSSLDQGLNKLQSVVDKANSPGPERQAPLHVELVVQAKGFAPQTAIVDLLDATNVANFTLSQGNVFRGRVLDEAGNPISNAVVQTDRDFKNQIATRFEWRAHTDADGRFEWDSAPAEEICYWFEADGYKAIRGLPLRADTGDHEIALKTKAVK